MATPAHEVVEPQEVPPLLWRYTRGSPLGLWALVALLLVAVAAAVLAAPVAGPREPWRFNRGSNAVWLDAGWLLAERNEAELSALFGQLAADGFRYAFADVGPVSPLGQLAHPPALGRVQAMLAAARAVSPRVTVLAWLDLTLQEAPGHGPSLDGLLSPGLTAAARAQALDLANPALLAALSTQSADLVERLGFAGVHLSVQGAPDGSRTLLTLLETVAALLPADRLFSVEGSPWRPDALPLPGHWTGAYLAAVARRADLLVVLLDDRHLPTGPAYQKWVAAQARGLLPAVAAADCRCTVLVGLPAHGAPRWPPPQPGAAVDHGLTGLAAGLASLPAAQRTPFTGVAVYGRWREGPEEWDAYRRLWLVPAGRTAPAPFPNVR